MDPVVLERTGRRGWRESPRARARGEARRRARPAAYLGEGDGDACIQLDVVGQLGELVLLLLERLQQAADLLLGQHHPAVVLRRENRRHGRETPLEDARVCISYLLKGFLTVQAGGGHLGQQDGHVLLLLPQPDQPLPDVGVHHAQRHLLLPTQRLVEVCEVSPHAGARALRRPGDLRGAGGGGGEEAENTLERQEMSTTVHASPTDPGEDSRVLCAPCPRRPPRSALRLLSAARFPPACGSIPTPRR